MDHQTAIHIARAIGRRLFESATYNETAAAQRNLSGITHYADPDTLKFFHSRILRCRAECEGLVLILVESVATDPRNTGRGFRFVAFDLFGSVINERPNATSETLAKSSDKARAAAETWLAGFDVLAHYRAAMAERAERLRYDAQALADCAATLAPATA